MKLLFNYCGLALGVLGLITTGCGSGDSTSIDVEAAPEASVPTYDEFLAMLEPAPMGGYLLESDIWLADDDSAARYYESTFLGQTEKSVVNLASGTIQNPGTWDERPRPLDIRYCFQGTDWNGQQIDTDGDGNPEYTSPNLVTTRNNLQAGINQWQEVANIQFTYVSSQDGNNCSTTGPNAVDFIVDHYGTGTIAIGPFPSNTLAQQVFWVPPGGLTSANWGAHEVGHTLGFRHEFVQKGTCQTETNDYYPLTHYDNTSTMDYSDCPNQFVSGLPVSRWDAVGAWRVYGLPSGLFAGWSPPVM